MAAHAGERARQTATYACEKCGETVQVRANEKIPTCPNCGNDTFGQREGNVQDPRLFGRDE
jgi:ribosomal protein L37AE/L43A